MNEQNTETVTAEPTKEETPAKPLDVKSLGIEGAEPGVLDKIKAMVMPTVSAERVPGYGMPGADQKKKMRAKGRRQRQARKLQRRLRKGRT